MLVKELVRPASGASSTWQVVNPPLPTTVSVICDDKQLVVATQLCMDRKGVFTN